MKRFKISLAVVCTGFTALLTFGSLPERRYADGMGCVYRAIYRADSAIGLAVTGGSQMQTAVDVNYTEELLAQRGISFDPVYSVARSNYSIATEHLLMEDLIEERTVKTALIMIEPAATANPLEDWVPQLASVADIPNLLSAMRGDTFTDRLEVVREVIVHHLKPTNDGLPPNYFAKPKPHCGRPDPRLDLKAMSDAEAARAELEGHALQWNLSDPLEQNLLGSVRRMKKLADQHDVELIYILMSATSDPLPDKSIEAAFFEATDVKLITFDEEIHTWLAENGRRDRSHINRAGREVFTPWLIDKISAVCARPEGCF